MARQAAPRAESSTAVLAAKYSRVVAGLAKAATNGGEAWQVIAPGLPLEIQQDVVAADPNNATLAVGGLGGVEAEILDLSCVEPVPVEWLWPGYIPLGALTVVDGDPGMGKSVITGADIAARLTTGLPMPDGQRGDVPGPAGVVLMCLDDDTANTLVPRLIAAGADRARVRQLRSFGPDMALPTVEDLAAIETAVKQVDARLLVIDPVAGHLPQWANPNRDTEVRKALAPLVRLAQQLGIAVVVVRHLTKAQGGNPLYRGQASIAFIAAARSGLLVAADADDDSRRVLVSTKHNLSSEPPALVYRLETAPENGVVRCAWLAVPTTHTAETLLAPHDGADDRSALSDAANFLKTLWLMAQSLLRKYGSRRKQPGLPGALSSAKDRVAVRCRRAGRTWQWSLPPQQPVEDRQDRQESQQ